jgi:hypothetical protein
LERVFIVGVGADGRVVVRLEDPSIAAPSGIVDVVRLGERVDERVVEVLSSDEIVELGPGGVERSEFGRGKVRAGRGMDTANGVAENQESEGERSGTQ